MITAKEALNNSMSFDNEAHIKKLHDRFIEEFDMIVSSKSKAGDTQFDWAPVIRPKEYPPEIFPKLEKTITDAGFTLIHKDIGFYTVKWA